MRTRVSGSFRKQTVGEELANAVSHGVGALLALIGGAVLLWIGIGYERVEAAASIALYTGSLLILYIVSTLYHGIQAPHVKALFRVLDHCSIFLLILGTYVPVVLLVVGGKTGWVLCLVNGVLAVIGMILNAASLRRFEKASVLLYLLMGWLAILVIDDILAALPTPGLIFLVAGGVAYTVGIIFYRSKRPYAHFIWHLFVLTGSVLHYICIAFYCLS